MMCQRIGRPPMSIIGFGTRRVSSPMRTPNPPQKITTFIRKELRMARKGRQLAIWPVSQHGCSRNWDDQLRAPLLRIGELLCDLFRKIPRKDHDRIRPCVGDALRRLDPYLRPRCEAPVLVRISIDGVVEEVRADAAVVQQRVPFPGCAV